MLANKEDVRQGQDILKRNNNYLSLLFIIYFIHHYSLMLIS